MDLVDEAREKAAEVLLGNASELGLKASRRAYRQVWARDWGISSLGLLLLAGEEPIEINRRSISTLRSFQSTLGHIPHSVGYREDMRPALSILGEPPTYNGRSICFSGWKRRSARIWNGWRRTVASGSIPLNWPECRWRSGLTTSHTPAFANLATAATCLAICWRSS